MIINSFSDPWASYRGYRLSFPDRPKGIDPRVVAVTKIVEKERQLAALHNQIANCKATISKLEADRLDVEKELEEARAQVQVCFAASSNPEM